MKNPVILALVALVGAVPTGAVADDSWNCGSKIIEIGMTRTDVLQYCGAPSAKTEEVIPVRSGNQVAGKTMRYRWTYKSYSATRVLVFDEDKLVSIQ